MNFSQQGEAWLEGLRVRKRSPIKPGTFVVYQSYLRNWILPMLGDQELATFGNAGMRAFAAGLVKTKPLSPKFLNELVATVKQIVASAINENGDVIYPRVWNSQFIDLPEVNPKDQKTPCPSKVDVERIIRQAGRHAIFYVMLAGTGLRIAEALSIRVEDDGIHTCWDPAKKLISVRSQLYRGLDITPKTRAGVREVDLNNRLNELLVKQSGGKPKGSYLFPNLEGRPMADSNLRKCSLKKLGVHGFHAFRRFRATRLREFGVPEDIIRFWLGHEGEGITDRYSKLAQNRELRASWADRVGLGFEVELKADRK